MQSNHVGTENEAAITDLEARVTAMRRLGVTRWADIELGPSPASAEPHDDEATQRSDRLAVAKSEREQRLRFGASGGPRPVAKIR